MTYSKPALHGYPAVSAIQDGMNKNDELGDSSDQSLPTAPAYQADE